jgi:hypothetical protein
MSCSVPEVTRVKVSSFTLRQIGAITGPVNDVFLIRTVFCHETHGIFIALHVVKKLIGTDFEFVVNQSRECEIFVRCCSPSSFEKILTALPMVFKFSDYCVKFLKVDFLDAKSEDEDIFFKKPIQTFAAHIAHRRLSEQNLLGYPVGYSDDSLNMEAVRNPRMSETTMSILGIAEGNAEGLVRVNLKYMLSPEYMPHATYVVPWPNSFKFAVDQNSELYMKFHIPIHAEMMTKSHFYIDGFLVKFHSVQTVTKKYWNEDIGKSSPVYSRSRNEDHFEILDA